MKSGRFVKAVIQSALLITCFFVVSGLKTTTESAGISNAVQYFKTSSVAFSNSTQALKHAIEQLDAKDSTSLITAKRALKESRVAYKKIEFFMNYFFESSSLIYNKPAKVEVEEPYMEYQEPSGFQVVEALLYDEDPAAQKTSLLEQADLLASSAADLRSLLYGFEATDAQLLESLRLELVRIITLSITGYDAPELKSGIVEAHQSLQSVSTILQPYLEEPSPLASQLQNTLARTLHYLQEHQDFDNFDRMGFLKGYALPLQEQLRDLIAAKDASLNDKSGLNYLAKNLFAKDALLPETFSGVSRASAEKIALGKKLFFEKALSGDLRRNCASCHSPQRYFSDGIKTSVAFDGIQHVDRNAPTLLYSGFQYSQFWDGRAKTLPEQILAVIANPLEMNGDHHVIIKNLAAQPEYLAQFDQVYGAKAAVQHQQEELVDITNLSDALAAYVMDLGPRNSDFDQYIAGTKSTLPDAAIKGFNLFMGKAQCATCHFAPLFNGLIPPLYNLTEYENLGTPANDDFSKLIKDKDKGRFGFFPISYYEAAFKTPTVRNAAQTAPYMHNGVFQDLEKLVQFYNQGGGAGLKMNVPGQTLSAKPLHLTDKEVKEIVVFMQSLTDRLD